MSIQRNSCPLCDSQSFADYCQGWDSEYCTSKEKFTYQRCSECHTVFINPVPVDRLSEIYPPTYYSHSEKGNESFLENIKNWLEKRMFHNLLMQIPGDQLRALDIGGGTGWMLSAVRSADPRVTNTHVIDFDSHCADGAKAMGHEFHSCRAEDYKPKQGEKFDLILCLNLIEHVESPKDLMSAMAGLLSEKGVLLVKTPNTNTLDFRLFKNHNWGGLHCPRHWVLFNRQGLSQLVEDAGLVVSQFSYTQGAPQWTASILGFLADKGFIKITREKPIHHHPLFSPVLALTAIFDMIRCPFLPTAQMFMQIKKGLPTEAVSNHPH